ncbi:hypothetical protein GLOTRDRAFT_128844 [Gloeophyllum trabeum ATCC 11539]|uniref:SMP domain-containing protein n=1 Tax=Gloeophyllum trabeum (strain ATCC 11539 / FP-39264 / Madison 617) TaxID=670483 RepID=S7RRM5_GLOTA|nr:uncharacterized protein GLOTRDRAFT_128844 [Gloeophyllum trabeum ATCC 11539]EPQ55624.1 hypothetical protein GLOTRDRAFT_128844 [Gloeophyllum trabeum ATCC 11539]
MSAARHPEGSEPSYGTSLSWTLKESAASTTADAVPALGLTEKEARKLESEEHKALGYRPPSDSLAAQAKSEASMNPQGAGGTELNRAELRGLAQADAARVEAERGNL